jgi:N-acetylmuramoyl-L-alanine amidase
MMRKGSVVGIMLVVLGLLWPASAGAQTWRVGLQVGHWKSNELPDELARLRTSTGAAAGGLREYQVNLDVAERAAGYLRGYGVAVDILPATVPVNYRADAFVSLHADGSTNTRLSGFKAATHWREWGAGTALVEALRAEYGPASGLAWDGGRITSNMRGYYAFSSGRYDHAIANDTPGAILEMGYLTSPSDRRLMTVESDRLGRAVADGILRFLRSEPAEGWPAPPPLPEFRTTVISRVANVRAGPGTEYRIVRTVRRDQKFLVSEIRGDWLKLSSFRSRSTERWIRSDQVQLQRLRDEAPQDS